MSAHVNRDLIFFPVLFLVLMTLLLYVRLIKVKIRAIKAGQVDQARRPLHEDAWPFVASRVVHAWIHLTWNIVKYRRWAYTVGWWALMFLVVLTIWQLGGRALT